jgi:acyl-CoA synthetase (AMP-forming)/AMP-acid ligase II
MKLYDSLTHILPDARDKDREIRFIDGDKDESTLSFAELWKNAVDLLGTLQNRGMTPGDELVIFTKSNQLFVTAFWAAVLGGLVPVPVAVGISDEHRLKLFRIMRQLQRGTLYSEHTLHKRLRDYARPRDFDDIMRKLESHSVLIEDVAGGQVGKVFDPGPEDTA